MMWRSIKNNRSFGGARVLLMHAAHPLIAVGKTDFFTKETHGKVNKNTVLQNSVTFGTKEEADDSAQRINKLHEVIKGEDEVCGFYDALDHEQLYGTCLFTNIFYLFL